MKFGLLKRLNSKNLTILTFSWLALYLLQISSFILRSVKDDYFFEILAVFHAVFFIVQGFLFAGNNREHKVFFALAQLLIGFFFIAFYSYGYYLITSSYFVPNASDAILYNDFALSALKEGFFVTVKEFLANYGVADLGAPVYVYLVYALLTDNPISVYFVNFMFSFGLMFLLKHKGESKYFSVLRLTLPLNPFLFFLVITSFKELPMLFLIFCGVRFFLQKRWAVCIFVFLLLSFFRPAISALFLAALFIELSVRNFRLIVTTFKVNKSVAMIIPIALVFLITFPLLLRFLESGVLATLDYYRQSPSLSSYTIPFAFFASFITGFLGPLFKPYVLNGFSLGTIYSFFYPIGMLLNLYSFHNIFKNRKLLNSLERGVFIFVVLGLLSISIMLRGFDLRYTLVFYLVLWWLSASVSNKSNTKYI